MADPVDFVLARLTGLGFDGVAVEAVDGDDATADVTRESRS